MIKTLSLILLFLLVGCSRPAIYDDYTDLFEWSDIESLGFEEHWDFVYLFNRDVFGTECPGCLIVRDDLLDWVNQNQEYELYLINERVVSGLRPIGIRSSPTLMVMYQGRIIHSILGAGPMLAFIADLDEGTIQIEDFLMED